MNGTVPICRATDITLGHDCHPPEVAIASLVSKNVFVEGQGVLRKDDLLAPHSCGKSKHQGIAVGGSSSVFVNNKNVIGLGGKVLCPAVKIPGMKQKSSIMATSARKTFMGGGA